jgi:Uma2 family endonuclease
MAKMADPVPKADRRYTYRDYASWPEGDRWELIDGVAWAMSPAPSTNHQRVGGELYYLIRTWLDEHDGPCEAFIAPFDALLPASQSQEDDDVEDVVQPDVAVICDPARVIGKGGRGAPP